MIRQTCLFSAAAMLAAGIATASTPAVGMASASAGLVLDDSRVSGNATLFSGSTVKTANYSRLQLKNGTRMDLGAGSKATIFENHASLESGMTEIKSGSGFELDAKSEVLKIVTSEDRTVADPSYTQVKLIVERRTKKIRGCVIIGNEAAEVINLVALAIQSGVTTSELEQVFLVHPSASVALQRCAAKFR